MTFDQAAFFVLFAAVWAVCMVLPHRAQNLLLLAASWWLYATWDPRFLALLGLSTMVDYAAGLAIGSARERDDSVRAKAWLIASVAVNLGLLGTFKYLDWFASGFADLMGAVGLPVSPVTLGLVLPVGISFYTFQTMAYTIDVYRGAVRPCRRLDDYALFVAFFPQLLAGPIERTSRLMPQITRPRRPTWQQLRDGQWLVVWGLFKKVYVADNLAGYLATHASVGDQPHGLDQWLWAVVVALVFYGDFSGYSDIARGLAKMFGIDLTINFWFPYGARNPQEFWRRWHVTLSDWFRDYVYLPLARWSLRRGWSGRAMVVPTMALVGLWHGAALHFVWWGVLWGVAMLGWHALRRRDSRLADAGRGRGLASLPGLAVTFGFFLVTSQAFLRPSTGEAMAGMGLMLTSVGASPGLLADLVSVAWYSLPLAVVPLLVAVPGYRSGERPALGLSLQAVVSAFLVALMYMDGARGGPEFLYFHF